MNRVSRLVRAGLTAAVILAAVGCVHSAVGDPAPQPEPFDPEPVTGLSTGAQCPSPSGPLPRYESFGLGFMRTYCLRCHTSQVTGSARAAPPDKNFDEPAAIRAHLRLIDQQAGAGPIAAHAVMPPDAPRPTLQERQELSVWLACGAP